jgi:hypothetical protein
MFLSMDAQEALDRLLVVSDEVRAAVVFEPGGDQLASNLPEDEASEIAGLADSMLAYGETLRTDVAVRQLQAVTPDGDVYLARRGPRAVVAIAVAGSLAGLVQHDLRTLLGSVAAGRRKATVNA